MKDRTDPSRPDPIAYLTGAIDGTTRPAGISLPGEGGKFATDGTVQVWQGNTLVCHVPPDSAAHDAIRALQEEVKMSRFARFFTFLPPSSFHMTVLGGMSPGFEPRGPRRDTVSAELLKTVEGLTFPATRQARVAELYCGHSLTMTGTGPDGDSPLRAERDALRAATGINPADYDDHVFHITLAYPVEWLTRPTAEALVAFSADLTARHAPMLADIPLGPVEFCNFETMHHFEPLKVLV